MWAAIEINCKKIREEEVQLVFFADVIVDISHEKLDKTYQYVVPSKLESKIVIGTLVKIPFGIGNRLIQGYVVNVSKEAKFPIERIKQISEVVENAVVIESQLIRLAYWIKDNYGATINDALKTVIPVKKEIKKKEKRYIKSCVNHKVLEELLLQYKKKNYKAKIRLLEALLINDTLEYEMVIQKLNIARSTLQTFVEQGIITYMSEQLYRNPIKQNIRDSYVHTLNYEQRKIADAIIQDEKNKICKTYLIHGVTGSGKTEIYMEVIAHMLLQKKQVIMLIPEIALTFQTVMRFYNRFGNRVSILHSRLSNGERYDQYTRAKEGQVDIMIGPRSALFTPFSDLGLIIIDEEHEASYKSDAPPKYHAREVAIERANMAHASVILGSATPSIESYKKAKDGIYQLFSIKERAGEGNLPKVWVADLREELKKNNKSIFSEKLRILMLERLQKKQQIILFINRRGYAGFVSCRSCGYVLKCPHCDVSLTFHKKGNLVCHYCGYEEPMPSVCPVCGSKYIAAFGTGTQKVEEMVKKEFPFASVLRMDADTTTGKEGHEKILSSFANQEADILIGTQMIVKGHDFPNVTLVGVLAADLSLYANDYRATERTFQLLAQAAGRAGRGHLPGEVVIQTYNPENYSIQMAKKEDYEGFYEQEMTFRAIMAYPPVEHMLVILITCKKEEQCIVASQLLYDAIREEVREEVLHILGPTKAQLSKINDIFRRVLYIKYHDYEVLKAIKDYLEGFILCAETLKGVSVQFDFNPLHGY